jgi:hypothetical protein
MDNAGRSKILFWKAGIVRIYSILVLFVIVLLSGCAPSQEETEYLARRAMLLRQNQGIKELIAEEEKGSLVPVDRFLIGVDEKVLGDIFRSQLPRERPLGERFVIRLEKAEVSLQDKYGLIIIEGNLHHRKTPERKIAVRIFGGLGSVMIDPMTNLLSIGIAIDHFELLQAGLLESILGSSGKKLFAKQGLGLLQDAIPKIQIPVALRQDINIPAIAEGGINLDSLTIPLDLSVNRFIAAGGKLWVTLNATVGTVTGAEDGLGVAVKKKPKKTSAPAPVPPPDNQTKPPSPDESKKGGAA